MKPFLAYGGSDAVRLSFAKDAAQRNNYNLILLNHKEFEDYSKPFLSSNLESSQAKNIFFIFDVNKWSIKQTERFFKLIKDSPHVFVLSSPTFLGANYILRKSCLKKNLGEERNEITEVLKSIMLEENRDSVRITIENIDPTFLFHILKKGAWRTPEVLNALIRISQKLYKSKPEFITSLLAFALPKRAFALSYKKPEKNKLEQKILRKISKAYKLNSSETAGCYTLISRLKLAPVELRLDDKQKIFLGVKPEEEQMLEAPKIETANLSEFF